MSSLSNNFESIIMACAPIHSFTVDFAENLIDQACYKYKSFKNQFILELHIMEAIEHDYFEDSNNLQLIEPIYCIEDCEDVAEHDSELDYHCFSKDCENAIEYDSEPVCHTEKTVQETFLEQLFRNLRIEGNGNDEEKENQENEENDGKDETELELAKLLSLLKLKDVDEVDAPLVDLDLDEMAAALYKLSLVGDSPDIFDRDLAVFDSDGNIAVEDTSVFVFLQKILSGEDNAERRLMRRLLELR